MKKRLLVVSLLASLTLLLAFPVNAAWDEKVTGGGQAYAGSIHFTITASAWDDGNGGAGGQIEYSRHEGPWVPLSMHATVECVYVGDGVAVLAGPMRAQDDPSGWVDPSMWLVVNIREGGIGAGDTVRVYKAAPGTCGPPVGGFPGYIYDGNFNIRTK